MTVLVLDGSNRASLAMVRSLGRQNIPVHVGETYKHSLATFSKYCDGSITYANPEDDRERFIRDLKRIVADRGYEMLLSAREVTTIPLSYYKEDFEPETTIPYPHWETMRMTVDKSETFSIADEVGVPIPETHVVETPEELAELETELEYPLVVKPRSKTTWVDGQPIMMKVTKENYVNSFEELLPVAKSIYHTLGVMPLVQEYIPGEGYGVEVLCDSGDTEALFMHRRLREYPITGGASTYRESVYESILEEPSILLMDALDWNGVAMVEFRLDRRDGVPKLMEVNGRFWGSLPLAIAAGIDFPYLLYRLLQDESIPDTGYREGVKSRWLLPGDILWLLATLYSEPDRLDTVREFSSFGGTNYDILSLDDPLPVLGSLNSIWKKGSDVIRGNRDISGGVKQ